MSELTTGGINFGYQSPISQIYKDVEYKFKEDMENKIMEAVHHFGISVDKEELIKALQYDRNQYDKGYSDGRASIVAELERLEEEIEQDAFKDVNGSKYIFVNRVNQIIDKYKAELKGENRKDCSTCKSDNSHENCLGCIEYGHWELKGE